MFFQNKNQVQVFKKIKDLLLKEYGQKYVGFLKSHKGEEIGFLMAQGSTEVRVHVYPFKTDESNVTI